MWNAMSAAKKSLTVLLAIIGILGIVAGVLYVSLPAKSLPSFFPDHSAHTHLHATKHGIAAIVVGAVFLIVAVILVYSSHGADE
jgi:uncharacterized membrane protein HdeD (DUF308 family)